MADEIKIHLSSQFDDKGVSAARRSLSNIRAEVQRTNRATRTMGGAVTAANQQMAKSAISAEVAMSAANGGMEGISKFLAGVIPGFKSMGDAGVAAFGAIVGAAASLLALGKALTGLFATIYNWGAVDKSIRDSVNAVAALKREATEFKEEMAEARKVAAEQSKHLREELDSMKKMVDAQIELNRQKDLSLAKTEAERRAIDARYKGLQTEADDEYAQQTFDARAKDLDAEEQRLLGEISKSQQLHRQFLKRQREFDAALPKAAEDTRGVGHFMKGWGLNIFGGGKTAEQRKFDNIFNASVNSLNAAREQEDAIEAAEKKLLEIERQRGQLAKDRKAHETQTEASRLEQENAVAVEREKQQAEAAKKDEEARKQAIVAAAAAEKAAHDARMKQQAEEHKLRMDNLRKEQQASQAAGSARNATIAAAKTEFDRAFGWYRNKGAAEQAIAEERDYAADLKQLHKDANRYGGKWRIDELSRLMSAGDTAGYQSTLEQWRKSGSFTPEVEAMVRASAAERTKTTAEDELRKIEANTADLAAKLDELLTLKGGN